MDRRVMDYLERKMRDGRDNRDGRDGRDGRDNRDGRDGRRGVRGSGRGRRGGRGRRDNRRDYNDYEDYDYDGYDGADYEDYADYDETPLRLSKSDMHKWKKMMENYDGTKGVHYEADEVQQIAEKLNVSFDDFNEKEFCLAVNMMYSDYGHVIRKYVPPERELQCCAELAKAFLDDPDGPESSEKLALYFHCIVCNATF